MPLQVQKRRIALDKKSNGMHSSIESHLQEISDQLDSHPWTIQELFQTLKGRGSPFFIIFLSLPFCQPFQIPGFAIPFGIVIMFVGLRMIFGHRVWWPQWVLKKEISAKLLKVVIQKSLRFFQFLKFLIHPRWSWLSTDFMYRVHGGFVVIMAIYLALPLPIPFTNILSAWALLLLGLGLIEEDGLFICLGYILGLITMTVLGFLIKWLHTLIF